MAKILVFSELNEGRPKSVTLEILSHLSGHEVEIASFQSFSEDGLKDLKEVGAKVTYHLENGGSADQYSPEGYTHALKEFIQKNAYTHVMAGGSSAVKDFFPRLSAELNAGMASDVTAFKWEGDKFIGTRPLFAGKCLADFELVGPAPHFISVRPNALGKQDSKQADTIPSVETAQVSTGEIRAKIKEVVRSNSERPDLTEANIIISGGRAMKNSENFKILEECADVVGATVGASRAAVDSGYAPPAMQVGQTGKTVSPNLYIACGISGAIQHLAGMRTSKVIVAINTDPDAPIFQKADYGIVGDLFKIVPILKEELKAIVNS